ncbi:Survival protein SurA precursor (Peptidyl-prolyl cis-trans isomerase SurA) [Tenacibaculum sp. 190130A14a]|uniref:Peptidyl-prolyl cis-trans isomerase SurA n=1 Tax=Tenacibaculum polynesiense TaxID=3137857 RepID=A0ABM9P7Q9_9FLAO
MKKGIVLITSLMFCVAVFAQKSEVLLTVNDEPVFVDEFRQVYEKNLDLVEDEASKSIDNYLELYINYKLKVKEAYDLKLDTISSYRKELEGYKKQLLTPYLQDKSFIDRLIKEAYERSKFDVKASHILIRVPKHILPQDTLSYYNRIVEARKRIVNGAGFEAVAKEVSEDPSVVANAGDLGYFNVFKMVYPFEDASYTTKVRGLSKPFRTKFGYHIVKVFDKRPSKGAFEVAHILLRDKVKLDSIYKIIKEGKASFEDVAKEISEDKVSAQNGGKLKKFGTGDMVENFEQTVLSLKEENEISKPFKTEFGWHIVKLLKRYPVASFEEVKPSIEKKVRNSSRIKLSDKAMLDRLKAEYTIKVYEKALQPFDHKVIDVEADNNLSKILLVINDKKIQQIEFYKFIKNKRNHFDKKSFNDFKDFEVLNYFKDNLIQTNKDFRNIYLEYKEGLLLFELMQRKIWNESTSNKAGLEKFYEENKTKYNKELSEIRGIVISDYQKAIEDKWIKELRNNNIVKVKKRALKKLKKSYKKT